MSIEDLNVPISLGVGLDFRIAATTVFSLPVSRGEGVVNPWEHSTPDGLRGDVDQTVRRWFRELRNSLRDEKAVQEIVETYLQFLTSLSPPDTGESSDQ